MSTSLFNRRLRWTDIAGLLDVGYESQALPALVTCPLCQEHALRVYEDTVAKGPWFHCGACGRGGDCVTFPAAVWGLDVAGAVEKLIAEGLLPESARRLVPLYISRVSSHVERMSQFWAAARGNLPGDQTPSIARLTRALHLNTDLPPERWRTGMGTLVGAATKQAVEALYTPNVNFSGRGNPSCVRVFRGHGWKDVLTLPYHSSAGRLSGFTFVGRHGGQDSRVFAPVRNNSLSARKDAGLYAPHAADGHGTVVAVNDAVFALKQHNRHFGTSGRFLGLVAWLDDGTHATGRDCWQQLNGKRVVHWVREIDAALVRQAFYFDADVSTAGPDRRGEPFDLYCRRVDPSDLLRRVVRLARPWRYALSDWLREANPVAIEVLARRLTSYGIDPHAVAVGLPDREAADRLHGLGGPARGNGGLRYATFADGIVSARPDGWYYVTSHHRSGHIDRRESRISNFTLAINQVRVTPDGEIYDCDVRFQGRTYPVELVGDKSVLRQLLRHSIGVLYSNSRWSERLLQVAAAFDQPPIVMTPS